MKRFDDPSMVKAVARVLINASGNPDEWEEEEVREYYCDIAKAAITAMLEAMKMTEDYAWNLALAETKAAGNHAPFPYFLCLQHLGLITKETTK